MSPEQRAVLRANEAFYAAFRAHDLVAMDILWSRDAPVLCVHPGWEPLEGREVVMRSWHAIFDSGVPEVTVTEPRVAIFGDVACVVCLESIADGDRKGTMAASNVFVREENGWRMVHHHSGPVAQPDDDEEEEEPRLLN